MKEYIYNNKKENHISCRKYYFPLYKSKKITKIFRPGKRNKRNKKSYFIGQVVSIKELDILGSDYYKIEPKHKKRDIFAIITKVYVKEINKLTRKDFKGSAVKDKKSLIMYLALIYNFSLKKLNNPSFFVTITEFKYLDPKKVKIKKWFQKKK